MDTEEIDPDDYVRRWSSEDTGRIAAYTSSEVRESLWPWLVERGYAAEGDDHVLNEFLQVLGKRQAHLRPGPAAEPSVEQRRRRGAVTWR
jgi:hypothetical protein